MERLILLKNITTTEINRLKNIINLLENIKHPVLIERVYSTSTGSTTFDFGA